MGYLLLIISFIIIIFFISWEMNFIKLVFELMIFNFLLGIWFFEFVFKI